MKYKNILSKIISIGCIMFIFFSLIGYYYLYIYRVFTDYQITLPKTIYWMLYKVNWENVILIGGIVVTSLISILLIDKNKINISLILINFLIFILYFILKIWWNNVNTDIYELQIFVCYRMFFLSLYSGLLIGEIIYLFKDTKLIKLLKYIKFSFLILAILMFVLKLIESFDFIGLVIINNLIIVAVLEGFEIVLFSKNKNQLILDSIDIAFVVFTLVSLVVLREKYILQININEYEGLNLKLFICRLITLLAMIITYSLRHILCFLETKHIK